MAVTIRSTNPKIMDDNILKLENAIKAADVSANPTGTAEETLLTTIGIDGKKYDIGASAENVSYDNTDSGLTATNAQAAIDELSEASSISYNNTTSGLTADDVQDAIDEVSATRKVIVTSLPENVSSLEVNSNLEFPITENLNGYALTGFVVITSYGHKTTIMSRFLEYAVVIRESSTTLVCQILTKAFSASYNNGTVYLIFDKVS